jgi:molybdopterin-binding protein
VAIARALAIDAKLYLFDEVTSNIDIEKIAVVEHLLKQLQLTKNATVIITTHSKRQAYRLTSNVISIVNGKITKAVYENIFTGSILEKFGSVKTIKISDNIELTLVTDKVGKATISIPPHDIIVSKEKLTSSAVNCFKGNIIKIENKQDVLKLSVDIGVKLTTLITKLSFEKLKLNINSPVFVTFKANCVKILT